MKKLFAIISAVILFSCCEPSEKKKIVPTNVVFTIENIEAVKDSSGIFSKYHITFQDTLFDTDIPSVQSASFSIIDTSGKYNANQKLILTLQPDTSTENY